MIPPSKPRKRILAATASKAMPRSLQPSRTAIRDEQARKGTEGAVGIEPNPMYVRGSNVAITAIAKPCVYLAATLADESSVDTEDIVAVAIAGVLTSVRTGLLNQGRRDTCTA